ncbi:PREDICTED: chymotrypsinogen B-like [Condylura cristata]|uniref:chymotrypsinogen B-like n=1 Tax=Condylura cristata TaxID=143302 RepID=UPI000643134C|nr:PREDICTED: chymotrypsinogen B-like [Condylura cristata]
MALFWLLSCFALFEAVCGCGVPAIHPARSSNARIINGLESLPGSCPWHVTVIVFNHPKFHRRSVSKDITLVKLVTPVRLSKDKATVCLPQNRELFPVNTLCLTSGWGSTRYNVTSVPQRLQQSYMTLMDNQQCMRYWGTTVPKNVLCAGSLGVTMTKGDSGNPLVCLSNNTWTLVGLMSQISKANSSYKPFFSPRITSLLPWIKKTMRNES